MTHLLIAPEHLEEMPYIGILFVVGSVALLAVAAGLGLRNPLPAWLVGAAVSGGMILGFTLSRTVGLPDYHEEDWDTPYGQLSMIAEVLFLAAFAAWYGTQRARGPVTPARVKVPADR
ncbi:hypothetical protein ACWD4J_19880 [Streptomyces sp. NPDC002577]